MNIKVTVEGTKFDLDELFSGVTSRKDFGVRMLKENRKLGIFYGVQFIHYTHSISNCGHYNYRMIDKKGVPSKWVRIRKSEIADLLEYFSSLNFKLSY